MNRRYLVSAQLRPQIDDDLRPWVEQLAADGRLSDAVRDGLRLLHALESTPGGSSLVKRGLVAQALDVGVLQVVPIPPTQAQTPIKPTFGDTPGHIPHSQSEDSTEQNLDALLTQF